MKIIKQKKKSKNENIDFKINKIATKMLKNILKGRFSCECGCVFEIAKEDICLLQADREGNYKRLVTICPCGREFNFGIMFRPFFISMDFWMDYSDKIIERIRDMCDEEK